MRKTYFLYFVLLFLVFFTNSCNAPKASSRNTEAKLRTLETITATQTPISTLIPSIPFVELPNKQSDATQWKNKLKGIEGEYYQYDSRDISPDGRLFVTLWKRTLRLIPLDNLSQKTEYQIEGDDILYMWVYSWSPDSSAFIVCVNFTDNPNGCQAIKIFEVSHDDTLKEQNLAWHSVEYFDVLWAGYYVWLISPSSGIYMFNRKGSLSNHAHIHDITYSQWVKEENRDLILAVERAVDPQTLEYFPSKIYEIDRRTLEQNEIYRAAVPLNILGSDSDAKYLLFEEISSDRQQSISLDLFDLETRTIIQRYVFPPNSKTYMRALGQNQIAFEVITKDEIERKIWVYDFMTRRIEVRGTGLLKGWLPPNEGFLIRDNADNWTLLTP